MKVAVIGLRRKKQNRSDGRIVLTAIRRLKKVKSMEKTADSDVASPQKPDGEAGANITKSGTGRSDLKLVTQDITNKAVEKGSVLNASTLCLKTSQRDSKAKSLNSSSEGDKITAGKIVNEEHSNCIKDTDQLLEEVEQLLSKVTLHSKSNSDKEPCRKDAHDEMVGIKNANGWSETTVSKKKENKSTNSERITGSSSIDHKWVQNNKMENAGSKVKQGMHSCSMKVNVDKTQKDMQLMKNSDVACTNTRTDLGISKTAKPKEKVSTFVLHSSQKYLSTKWTNHFGMQQKPLKVDTSEAEDAIRKIQNLDNYYETHLKCQEKVQGDSPNTRSSSDNGALGGLKGRFPSAVLFTTGGEPNKPKRGHRKKTRTCPSGDDNRLGNAACHNVFQCDFCDKWAFKACQNCSYYYCNKCLKKLHPKIGPFALHSVISMKLSNPTSYCAEHGLGANLFCNVCHQKRCVVCVNTQCSLHFLLGMSDKDVDKERHQLLDNIENVSASLSSVSRYREQAEDRAAGLQTKALLRKIEISGEFRALRDALREKETQLYLELDKVVGENFKQIWKIQDTEFKRLEKEEAELTATVTELVQTTDRMVLLKGSESAHASCSRFLKQVGHVREQMKAQERLRRTTLLDCPFSLYKERKHVQSMLDNCFATEPQVVFRQKILCAGLDIELLRVGMFVILPDLPPSTSVSYSIEILQGRESLASAQTDNLETLTFSLGQRNVYEQGQRYIVKLTPVYLHYISALKRENTRGRSTHMMILLD